MSGFTDCQGPILGEDYVVCEDICLLADGICTVYLGPCGVYVISKAAETSPEAFYHRLRELLGTSQIRLYAALNGLYDPVSNVFGIEFDDVSLTADVDQWLFEGPTLFKPSVLADMVDCLKFEEAKIRGFRRTEDGAMYVYRHGEFKPASPVSADLTYVLALFGGTLGLHRFVIGKWLSGLLYFFTGGMFLAGWLADILFLLLGIQKDKQKRYLFPLSERRKKLLMLPAGLILGGMLFFVYLLLATWATNSFQFGLSQQFESTDPQSIRFLTDYIADILSQFESKVSP